MFISKVIVVRKRYYICRTHAHTLTGKHDQSIFATIFGQTRTFCLDGFQIDLSILSLCTEHTFEISGFREREHREGGQTDELQEAATPSCHHGTPEENGCHHGSTATAG